jgi:dCMP deaminase
MSDRPTRDEMLMDMAQVVAARGTCSRLRVGAIIARDGRALSMGYNGAPAGMKHCNHTMDESGIGCTRVVHAEANAIVWAARHGVATDGAELFTTHMPCLVCANLIINAGIIRVVYSVDYRDRAGYHLLIEVGMEVDKL